MRRLILKPHAWGDLELASICGSSVHIQVSASRICKLSLLLAAL